VGTIKRRESLGCPERTRTLGAVGAAYSFDKGPRLSTTLESGIRETRNHCVTMLQSVFGFRGEESRSRSLSESYAEELEWVLSVTLSPNEAGKRLEEIPGTISGRVGPFEQSLDSISPLESTMRP
jgi:hypothetical protein